MKNIIRISGVILLIVLIHSCRKEEVPVLITSEVTNINATAATSGGIILDEGSSTVIARGVCWSTGTAPTILDYKTEDGLETGEFISNITGLTVGINYYVRAYATNSEGTAYGNEINFTTVYSVGDSFQGGIIAYVLQPGDPGYVEGQTNGLIATPSDQSTGIKWSPVYGPLGPVATSLGAGNANTNQIVANYGGGSYAARLCYDLVLNGYNDWYLPSQVELNKLYTNRISIGGFTGNNYWSSTGWINTTAIYQNFSNGDYGGNHDRFNTYAVRAIRSF